jgi:putative Mn2+ efflux pump MntP
MKDPTEPSIGKENLGAVIGAAVGAVGGLIAIAIPYAILTRNIQSLSSARNFGLIGFLVCTPIGWFAGGYLSHFLERFLPAKAANIVGGIVGGLLPVTGVALYGWHMATR